MANMSDNRALIFDIKRDCSEDGPGIRTTVFFKGCPLSCDWCQNPEGKDKKPGLMFKADACHPEQCQAACMTVCPEPVFTLNTGRLQVDHQACSRCERCFKVCPSNALQPVGYWIALDELLYRLMIDKPFYASSSGGVTLSGGEATQQMGFVHRLLKALKAEGIHTALETSGFFNYRRFVELVLPYLDLIYFDLKLINDNASRRYTGQSSLPILENFVRLVKAAQIPVIPRVPLIPNITTRQENLQGIARFLEANGVPMATLLPYNPLWVDKVEKLGKPINYQRTAFMTPQQQEACVQAFNLNQNEPRSVGYAD